MTRAERQRLVNEYVNWLKQELRATELDGSCQISTPFLDRHNDAIEICVEKRDGSLRLTDDGYTIQDLRAGGMEFTTDKRKAHLAAVLNGFGVRREGDEICVVGSLEDFPQKKHNLVQAILAVNDVATVTKNTIARGWKPCARKDTNLKLDSLLRSRRGSERDKWPAPLRKCQLSGCRKKHDRSGAPPDPSYCGNEKLSPLVREIGWTHNVIIMMHCEDGQEREFYIRMTRSCGWTKNVLAVQIDNQAYEKTLLGQTNFDRTLPARLKDQAKLAVRDEYTFDFLELGEEHSERELERAILGRVENFLREMGG